MPSKFDGLRGVVPILPEEFRKDSNFNRQMKVDAEKAEIKDRSVTGLIRAYAKVRAEFDVVEAEYKRVGVKREAFEQLIINHYEAEKIDSMGVALVGTVRRDYKPYAKVVDKPDYQKWSFENKKDQLSLPWPTLNSIVSEMLLDAQEPPPGIEAYLKPTPVFVKFKG